MTNPDGIQSVFFQQIKDRLAPNVSLVDEVADTLKISSDSAYRRIRGEKQLSFEEIQILSGHFGISVDSLFNNSSEAVTFNYKVLHADTFNLEKYLQRILENMKRMDASPEKEILYLAKDIPLFQLFQVLEVAQFKMFFWRKTIAQFPDFEKKKFSLKDKEESILNLANQLLNIYLRIPSTEIWSEETITSILKQMDFYYESGVFEKKDDALLLCDKLSELTAHVQKQAELGFKFLCNQKAVGREDSYKLYYNELVVTDNTILIRVGDMKMAYLVYNTINYLTTSNASFCDNTFQSLKQLMSKSVLISGASEKTRNKIFLGIQEKISSLKSKIVREDSYREKS